MKNKINITMLCMVLFAFKLFSCSQPSTPQQINTMNTTYPSSHPKTDTATFGAGCFWCVEAVFLQLEGVISVTSGYAGGSVANPTYKQVCDGNTGHAEVCNIVYDPAVIGFKQLLQAFWYSHDPTTLNRQGNDIGTQYRSVIFYRSDEQKQLAEKYKAELDASAAFSNKIVTEISPLTRFYVAEDYHQDYYNQNGDQPYCQFVIKPKLDKFKKVFAEKLRMKKP
jgi:peptide-methionine (S)-S-oxide reductase